MDLKMRRPSDTPASSNSSVMGDPSGNLNSDQKFLQFDSTNLCYGGRSEQSFPEFSPSVNTLPPSSLYRPEHETKTTDQFKPIPAVNSSVLGWDPRAMLNNLSFLEQKIHQVQNIVRSIISHEVQFSNRAHDLAAQQQLVTADLTCIIIQLISTAGTLLPSVKNTLLSTNLATGQLGSVVGAPSGLGMNGHQQQSEVAPPEVLKDSEYDELIKSLEPCGSERVELMKLLNSSGSEGAEPVPTEDHDAKEFDDSGDGENLPPGSYEVLQLEKEEILAPHTHFCMICGKGFKRDANLRMHMRGHGDEYKTPAALAKPCKESSSEPALIKRYSCPFVGCKRNKEHRKFQPLKTILCVKNHYKRSHCDKSYTCSRCNTKKFSVIADLKTHEKHCGRDKWLCSCGTTFSRKDKLFGHVALFQGHTPALPMDEGKASGTSDQAQEVATGMVGSMDYSSFGGHSSDDARSLDIKGVDDGRGYFSPMNFDSCNFGGLDEFSRSAFEVSDSPFSFIPPGSCSFQRDGDS